MTLASEGLIISGPRAWRFIFFGRLICRWRRWEGYITTLPLPVSLKRFLAPLFVFILGIFVFLQRFVRRLAWRLGMPVHSAVAAGAQECGLIQRRQGKGKAPTGRSPDSMPKP